MSEKYKILSGPVFNVSLLTTDQFLSVASLYVTELCTVLHLPLKRISCLREDQRDYLSDK